MIDHFSYVLHSKVAHTSRLDFSVLDGIFDRFPRLQPFAFTSIRTVQEEKVDVAQTALLHRLFDGFACSIIGGIGCKLGRKPDVLPFQ